MGRKSKRCNLPVRETMCATCPFKEGSKYALLKDDILKSAMTEATRICHSTGLMCALEVIAAPTDEAWNDARVAMGMVPQITQDPKK